MCTYFSSNFYFYVHLVSLIYGLFLLLLSLSVQNTMLGLQVDDVANLFIRMYADLFEWSQVFSINVAYFVFAFVRLKFKLGLMAKKLVNLSVSVQDLVLQSCQRRKMQTKHALFLQIPVIVAACRRTRFFCFEIIMYFL